MLREVWFLFSQYENGNEDEWDDSRLSKEEIEARTRKKFEAMIKRERAMAYAYSHQVALTSYTRSSKLRLCSLFFRHFG